MQLSTEEVIIILQIVAFVLLLVLLYHLIFAAVSLRKVLKRVDTVTDQVEQVLLKPISMADATVDWISGMLEGAHKKHTHKKAAPKKDAN
jgi:cell shape-determining protein MreC